MEYQVRYREGVLVINSAAVIEPVAEDVTACVQQYDSQDREQGHQMRLDSGGNQPFADKICISCYYWHC